MRQHTIESFTNALNQLAKMINKPSVNDRLARKCREIIYRRVKNGYGVNSDTRKAESTSQVKLKPLSKSYIAQREGKLTFMTLKNGQVIPVDLGKYGKKNKVSFRPILGVFGRPRKSNATFTGEMLESLSLRSTSEGFQLLIMNYRRKDDSGLTNYQVAKYYSEDRPFFALTSGEIRIIARELENIVKDLIKENF